MAIDVHSHLYPTGYMEVLGRVAEGSGPAADAARLTVTRPIQRDPVFSGALDERVAMMDAAGVDTHVLSFSAPNVWHTDPVVRTEVVRAFNDGCAEVAEQYPGRFALFANMPLPHVDEAIAEAERALDTLGAVGIGIATHIDCTPIDGERLEPFYRYLDERGATLFFHPDGFCAGGLLADHNMEWGLGPLFDDTIVTVRLIYSGMLQRYPNITWIVPHLGGTIPFTIERIDRQWRQQGGGHNPPEAPSSYLDHIFFDTVTHGPRSLRIAREVLGASRLVFGSDYPWASRQSLGHGIEMLQEAGFTDAEMGAVLRGNIAPHLGMPVGASEG